MWCRSHRAATAAAASHHARPPPVADGYAIVAVDVSGHHTGAALELPGLPSLPAGGQRVSLTALIKAKVEDGRIREFVVSEWRVRGGLMGVGACSSRALSAPFTCQKHPNCMHVCALQVLPGQGVGPHALYHALSRRRSSSQVQNV